MFLPKTDKVLPWTALMLGLWIPNFYYWGLNQYITQRTLGSKSLAQGQKGIVFAAFMKLLIPFAIVIPGIIAFNLYSKDMQLASAGDNAPVMVKYQKANPATEFIQVIHDPPSNSEEIQDGKFAILVFNTKDQAKEFKSDNAYVLPITKEKFDESIESMEQYTFFASDDLAWKNIYPGFDAEINAYNADVNEAAVAADVTPNTEKMIVYKYDTALAHLLGNVLPQGVGLLGFILAALLGAVVSSLAAMLNAASTIFSMDIYKKYFKPDCSQSGLVLIGRICVVVFTIVAVFLAPKLGDPKINNSIFTIIQESQGLISPGILAVFVFGLLIRKGPPIAGVVGLLTNIVSYGGLYLLGRYKIGPEIQYLNRMAICFVLCLVIMGIITLIKPLAQPIEFKKNTDMDLTPSKSAKIVGIAVVVITVIFYLIFSPLGIAK
jgi:SSS family solute:Na+ symporter